MRNPIGIPGAVAVLVWAAGAAVTARARDVPDATDLPPDYRWQDAARDARLTAAQIDQLKKEKLVIASKRTHRQAYEGYHWATLPVFVTSDSMLAGYHTLFEESLLRLERARANQLPPILRVLWDGLDVHFVEKDALPTRAGRRAKLVVGVARRLAGDDAFEVDDANLAREIDEQVKRVVAGNGEGAPGWLTEINYTRFRPRSFYGRSAALARYFRAVAWLQAVPFYVKDEESFAAILLIGRALRDLPADADFVIFGDDNPAESHAFFTAFSSLLGPPDDMDVRHASRLAREVNVADTDAILKKRDEAFPGGRPVDDEGDAPRPQIDDGAGGLPHFRVLSAHRTSDSVLFEHTTHPRLPGRELPSGLDVMAALSSEEAAELLAKSHGGPLIDAIKENAFDLSVDYDDPLFSRRTLYEEYLACLRPLLDDEPEPGAPPLFATQAWRRKNLQAACAGWAQIRHAWALQAKEGGGLFGGVVPVAGFVEPVPEFFSRLADLAVSSRREFEQRGALGADPRTKADALRAMADLIERRDVARRGAAAVKAIDDNPDDWILSELVRHARWPAPADDRPEGTGSGKPLSDDQAAPRLAAMVPHLRKLADAMERGGRVDVPRELPDDLGEPDEPLAERWHALALLARRLEAMAHKQLRGLPASPAERAFLRGYGEALGEVMGNPFVHGALDDAPRVAGVYHRSPSGANLLVGTGRPTSMFVLYPWTGRDVLCEGVVVPYHEFTDPDRLTNDEWRARLDANTAPPVPDWVRALYNDDPAPNLER